MQDQLTFASAFAGIGGFDLALERVGMKCTTQIEINPQRHKTLARHWPTTPRGEDIRDVSGTDLGRPDVFVAGFPCKDLSRGKGKRKGLQGDQSTLYWEFQRLVAEHLRLVDAARPTFTVLENVPDLRRSNGGRDLAAVLMGLEQLGYGWAFRVVDARHLGSSQRRPRIVIVGHRGRDPRPAWLVLADDGPGAQVAALHRESTGGQRSDLRETLEGVRVFRKSSRPRAKAVEGGWANYVDAQHFNTLTNNDSGSNLRQTHIIHQDGRLRALTPVEWERLQGFPDNWTIDMPERERYLALGDAMNVNVAEWLGRRIQAVHQAVPLLPAVA